MDWITCTECQEEFKVIADSLESISYCPFCSADIVETEDEESEDLDE